MSKGITISDIKDVADTLNINLSEDECKQVLEGYESECNSDPTATWDLVVENCIYNHLNLKR